MKDGAILAEGPPSEVVDAAMIAATFGLDCEVVRDPVSATPMVVPRGRHHGASAAPAVADGATDVAARHPR